MWEGRRGPQAFLSPDPQPQAEPLMRDPQAELHVPAQDGPRPELASQAGQDAGIDVDPEEPVPDLGQVERRQQGGVPVNEEAADRGEVNGASTAMRQGCYTAVRVHRGIPDLDDEQHVGGSRVSGPSR